MKIPKTGSNGPSFDFTNLDANSSMLLQIPDLFTLINNLMTPQPSPLPLETPNETISSGDLVINDSHSNSQSIKTSIDNNGKMNLIPAKELTSPLANALELPAFKDDSTDPTSQEKEPVLKQILNMILNQPVDEEVASFEKMTMPTEKSPFNQALPSEEPNTKAILPSKKFTAAATINKNESEKKPLMITPVTDTETEKPIVANKSKSPEKEDISAKSTTPKVAITNEQPVDTKTDMNVNSPTHLILNTTIQLTNVKAPQNVSESKHPSLPIEESRLNLQVSMQNPSLDKQNYDVIMKIHPPSLGEIIAKIHTNKNGTELHLTAENKQTQELILANMSQLKNEFQQSGVSIQSIRVDITQQQGSFNQQQSQSSHPKPEKLEEEAANSDKNTKSSKRNKKLIIDTYA